MNALNWVALMVVLLIVEAQTVGLTTIWFAGGCIAAAIACYLGAPFMVQIMLFFVVSLVLLAVTRPLAVKYVNRGRVKTNIDSLIGEKAVVTRAIDNLNAEGEAKLQGKLWMARAEREDDLIEKDTVVRVVRISGAKLIVERETEE